MTIYIKRDNLREYEIPLENPTLLQALKYIKSELDRTLSYNSSCGSSVCGSCAVRVDSKERLACAHRLVGGEVIEPLRNTKVIRDLVVDSHYPLSFNQKVQTWLIPQSDKIELTQESEAATKLQSNCILCMACFSACPVYEVNHNFIAPFTFTRALRYLKDARCKDEIPILSLLQTDGIYECTLCGECSAACPQDISSKDDVVALRNLSAMSGFVDPNFLSSFGGGLEF